MVSYIQKNTEKVCLLIYIMVNSLFAFKYSPYPLASALIYAFVIIAAYFIYGKYTTLTNKRFSYILVGAIIVLSVALFFLIDPYNVIVDRWSALYFWSEKLFEGEYPYYARTHLPGGYGSPFPVWQILHTPFFLLGEMGIAHIVVILSLFFVLKKYHPNINLTLFFLLIALSPAYWWEVSVRSDLMNNMFVCLLFITLFHYKFRQTKNTFALGLIIGLICCTRLLLIIPVAIYFTPYFISKENRDKINFLTGSILGFILPFVPLMIANWDMLFYFEYSPIVLQTRQATPITGIIALVSLTLCSFLWKNNYKKYLFCVCSVLFIFISAAFMKYGITRGILSTIINDTFDISYFGVALPFAIAALSLKKQQ